MEVMLNWLADATKYQLQDGRTVYTGPAPFAVDKANPHDMKALMDRPWVISHPDAREQIWRAIGLESYAIMTIAPGHPIGLLVKPWAETTLERV